MSCGFQGCCHQGSGVRAAFFQIDNWTFWGFEHRFHFGELRGRYRTEFRSRVSMVKEEQRALVPEVNIHAGLILQLVDKFWIYAGACSCQWPKRGGNF